MTWIRTDLIVENDEDCVREAVISDDVASGEGVLERPPWLVLKSVGFSALLTRTKFDIGR